MTAPGAGGGKAVRYFERLGRLLLDTEVTDAQGGRLVLEAGMARAAALLTDARLTGRTVMLIGNGGSAAIVSHVQNDFSKALGIRAMVFNEAPLLTALSNDEGYPLVFERPVELWAREGDILLAVSSSGRSENILRGVRMAIDRGCDVVTFSGFSPENPLRRLGGINFYVPVSAYGLVEVSHLALAHCLVDRLLEKSEEGAKG